MTNDTHGTTRYRGAEAGESRRDDEPEFPAEKLSNLGHPTLTSICGDQEATDLEGETAPGRVSINTSSREFLDLLSKRLV